MIYYLINNFSNIYSNNWPKSHTRIPMLKKSKTIRNLILLMNETIHVWLEICIRRTHVESWLHRALHRVYKYSKTVKRICKLGERKRWRKSRAKRSGMMAEVDRDMQHDDRSRWKQFSAARLFSVSPLRTAIQRDSGSIGATIRPRAPTTFSRGKPFKSRKNLFSLG